LILFWNASLGPGVEDADARAEEDVPMEEFPVDGWAVNGNTGVVVRLATIERYIEPVSVAGSKNRVKLDSGGAMLGILVEKAGRTGGAEWAGGAGGLWWEVFIFE
jgi:hypothetical protein